MCGLEALVVPLPGPTGRPTSETSRLGSSSGPPGPRLPARRLADRIPALSRNGFTHFRAGSMTCDEDGRSRCAVFSCRV